MTRTEGRVSRMEFHERMGIEHELHTFWNPTSEAAIEELIEILALESGQRVLDIACGPAETLLRVAEAYDITGIGVDLSPKALEKARAAVADRAPDRIEIVDAEGAAYAADLEERFDLVCLLGASWIWSGYVGTLEALKRLTKPGALAWFGEPYWKVDGPPAEYCKTEDVAPESFTTLAGLQEAVEAHGFRLVYLRRSTDDEWDRYEMLRSVAADRWAQAHPDHPDRQELLDSQKRTRAKYLRYEHEVLGWAQLLLRSI